MYVVVSYTRAFGRVIRTGLSLVAAYRLIEQLGRGAIFRSEGMSTYSRPIYPVLPHAQAGAASAPAVGGSRAGAWQQRSFA